MVKHKHTTLRNVLNPAMTYDLPRLTMIARPLLSLSVSFTPREKDMQGLSWRHATLSSAFSQPDWILSNNDGSFHAEIRCDRKHRINYIADSVFQNIHQEIAPTKIYHEWSFPAPRNAPTRPCGCAFCLWPPLPAQKEVGILQEHPNRIICG